MSFKCDPTTRTELNAAPNKLAWAANLNTALGNSRTITCKWDSNPNAADPWATGTVFRKIGSTGAFKVVGGKIVSLGRIRGTLVQTAVNVSTGKAVVRIEGNGRWIEGTLGTTAQHDFMCNAVFTDKNGLGIRPNFAISGDVFLPSGTGPAAPALDADAPDLFEVWNWTNPNAPTLVGTVKLNKRIEDFVYEDTQMAAEHGDVAVYQSTQSVMHGNHEFGFTLLASHKGNTEVGNKNLYQVIGSLAHRGTWTTYPFADTFNAAEHVAYPDPFKVVMKNAAGAVLHTFEMRDGLPINSPLLSQVQTATEAMRPHFNCKQQLPWENTRPKKSDMSVMMYPGVHEYYQRPSLAKNGSSFIAVEPMMTGGYGGNSRNGIHHIYAVGKWPAPAAAVIPNPIDPYLDNFNTRYPPFQQTCDGWGYEPGSFSTHNWYTGPGGPRADRSAIPSTLAIWATNPNGSRIQDNVPNRDWADGFLFGYFNHSNKLVTDPKTLKFVDNKRILAGELRNTQNYYGDYPGPIENAVDTRASMRGGEDAYHKDKTGRFFFSGWGRDPLHSYANAGWGALLLRSPLMAVASKFDATTQMMIREAPDKVWGGDDYMVRTQAWDWLHHVMAWKLASTHPLGFSRGEIEERFGKRLMKIWSDVYKPLKIDNDQSQYIWGLRTFGTMLTQSDTWVRSSGGQLAFYMGHVLMMMKQTGMWAAMMAKGGKIRDVLLMQIELMDRFCFGRLVDTHYNRYQFGGWEYFSDQHIPTSFADWSQYYEAQDGSDYRTLSDGTKRNGDMDVSDHLFLAYPLIRRDFFPEIAHPLMAQAVAKVISYQDTQAAHIAAAPNPTEKRTRDYGYGYPGIASVKPPITLGPAGPA